MKKANVLPNILKKIVGFAYNLFVGVMILMAGLIVLSSLNTPLKLRLFAVLSGSMEPAIPMGSLVIVLPQTNYQVNDVITVTGEKNAKETVTHRIIGVNQDNPGSLKQYALKGDANEEEDRETIPANRVVGKVFFHIPWLGRIISFAQTQAGFIAMIIIPATILIYSEVVTVKNEVVNLFQKKKKNAVIPEQKVVVLPARTQVHKHHHSVSVQKQHSFVETSVSIKRPISLVESPSLRRVVKEIPPNPPIQVSQQFSSYQQKIHHVLHMPEHGRSVDISV